MKGKKSFTYKEAGVDIEAGERLVQSIKDTVKETHNISVLSNIGGFGGFFEPNLNGFKKPVLVSSVDGVGTKLIVAFKSGIYDSVGQDLVNHCVNDIAVCGAEPLFFLDYFATGKLKQSVAKKVIEGFSLACKQNGCALIGGETAEMPDLYNDGEFDVSGTIVGIVDKDEIIDGSKVKKGDVLLGFPSTGLHTNGYSLARKVLFSRFDIHSYLPELEMTVAEALLKIHKSYLPLIRALKQISGVNAFSHITGGGIQGNTKRVIPSDLLLKIDWDSWQVPALFNLIREVGNVPEDDFCQAFNLGIGLVAIADPNSLSEIEKECEAINETFTVIGEIN